MMVCNLGILALTLAGYQGVRGEYTFKNIRAAYFVESRWSELTQLFPDLQRAESLKKLPASGPWLYLDRKSNRIVFSSGDDSLDQLKLMLPDFDVKVKTLTAGVSLQRTEWQVGCAGEVLLATNMPVSFGADKLGAQLILLAKAHPDGTAQVTLTLTTIPAKSRVWCTAKVGPGTVLRIVGGMASLVPQKDLLPSEVVITPPSGKEWEPFTVEITVRQNE